MDKDLKMQVDKILENHERIADEIFLNTISIGEAIKELRAENQRLEQENAALREGLGKIKNLNDKQPSDACKLSVKMANVAEQTLAKGGEDE